MRFAPPLAMRVADRGGGLNQISVRTYNERLVMSLLRQHGSLSRMAIGQHSGLSAQTVSVIVRALERDNFILPGEAQRGRVGPPSTPMFLNPDGAFAIGVSIGTKSIDAVLIDFNGAIRHHIQTHHTFPSVDETVATVPQHVETMIGFLGEDWRKRIVGVGIALPEGIESWPRPDWNAPAGETWRGLDFEASIAKVSDLPIYIQNDVTAAAGAEVIFGAARTLGDFAYLFIGAEAQSRLVLNHHVYAGRRSATPGAGIVSLIDLETVLAAKGQDASAIWCGVKNWDDLGPSLDAWIDRCAASLVDAIAAIGIFVNIDTAIIDGRVPPDVRTRLCALVDKIQSGKGGPTSPPKIIPGMVGAFAKAVGAAAVPLHSKFMVEQVGLSPT